MAFPDYVFVYEPGGPTNFPASKKFTWHPIKKNLGPNAGATPELLAELIATGLVDETEELSLGEWCKKLTHFPESITGLKKLRMLSVATGKFTDWQHVYTLESLKKLSLREKLSGDLPEGISGLWNLEELTIQGKRITSLPADLGELRNLKLLVIANTGLTELPASFGKLTALVELRMSFVKKLKALPDGLEGLRSLQILKTDYVPLAALPDGLGQLPELRKLAILHGKVKKLPSPVSWPKLQVLNLQGPLTKWPKDFSVPVLEEALLGEKFKELPPLPAHSLKKLWVNAPLVKVDPALATVKTLEIQCSPAAVDSLDAATRAVFGERLKPTWT